MLRRAIALTLLLLAPGCAPTPRPAQDTPPGPRRATPPAVLIVAIDGARWQDVFVGVDPKLAAAHGMDPSEVVGAARLMPVLYERAIARGSALGPPGLGSDFFATGPLYISLPGYSEMLTGRTSHGCANNECPQTTTPTLLEQCLTLPGVQPDDVAVISSWEKIERASARDPSRLLVTSGRNGGATRQRFAYDPEAAALLEKGQHTDTSPGHDDYRPDRHTAPIALRYVATHRPRCAFIGLGDTDEYAHMNNYRAYLQSLRDFDRFLGNLFATLDAAGEYGRATTVFITVDHGRSFAFTDHGKYPESSRAWLVATGAGIASRRFVHLGRPASLSDIAPTARVLLGLAPDTAPGAGSPLRAMLREDTAR